MQALALRDKTSGKEGFYGFCLGEPDLIWRKFVTALYHGRTHGDLDEVTRFIS
jgi:hypothetical protein